MKGHPKSVALIGCVGHPPGVASWFCGDGGRRGFFRRGCRGCGWLCGEGSPVTPNARALSAGPVGDVGGQFGVDRSLGS